MGSSKKPKVQVSEYRMSIHLGFCYAVDYLLEILVKQKSVWTGTSVSNQSIGIVLPSLFGGVKKEGGLVGTIDVLHGRGDQVLPSNLASKLGTTSANAPGFRDILSLFIHGGDRGFLWSANYPYLHEVWAKVSRTSSGWYNEKCSIGDAVTVDTNKYVLTNTYQVPSSTAAFPIILNVSGNKAHITYPYACADVSLGSGANPVPPQVNSTVYIIDVTTGVVDSTYTAPTYRYITPDIGNTFVGFPDLTTKYTCILRIGDNYLWHIYRTVNAGVVSYLAVAPAGVKPNSSRLAVQTDLATERIGGVAIDLKSEVVLVLVSNPTTKTTRWVEVDFDGDVLRSGACGFYASTELFGEPVSGVTTVWFGYGPSETENGYSTAYSYEKWTAVSYVNSVRFFQIGTDNVFRLTRTTAVTPTPVNKRASYFNGQDLYVMSSSVGVPQLLRLSPGLTFTGAGPQMNPAHIIREAFTNTDWGLGVNPAMIDDASFVAAADKLYDEGFGLSLQWTGQSSAEDFINDILSHIDATYGNDPATGKFYLKLIRDDYDVGALHELTDDDMTITAFSRNSLSDTSNEVVVTWTNPANEEEQTVTVHDIANYSAQGVIISTSRNYHAIRTADLALRCAMRELGKASQPVATFEAEANRMANDYKSGDVVKVTYPEYGLSGLPCRVMSVNRGKPGQMAVKLTLMEDVFNMPSSAYVVSPETGWEDTAGEEDVPLNVFKVESAPYYMVASEIGDSAASSLTYPESYAILLANGPGASYDVYTPQVDPIGGTAYQLQGTREYAVTATLGVSIGKAVTSSITLNALTGTPEPGMICFIGNELCVVESYDGSSLTVRRGMLDTVPVDHTVGERLWFFTTQDDISDPNTYTVGQTASYKLVPEGQTTSGSILITAVVSDRLYRPYRPANVKINSTLWPTVINGALTVSWSHRNRLMETSVLSKWDAASTTAEAGTTYTVRLYNESGTLTKTVTGLTGNNYTWSTEVADCGRLQGRIRVEVEAVRDGYTSFQKFDHAFDRAGYGLNYGNYYGGI